MPYPTYKHTLSMRGLNPDHLHAFVTIAELGSFSAAAARLNLTQPALSIQMRHLEERLGVRLIERVRRRAAPTAAGLRLLPHVRRIDEAMEAALAALADHVEGIAGRVRIGTGATACIYLLPPLLRDLRRRLPLLDIVVATGNTPDILHQLHDNLLDVAVVTLPAPGRSFATEPLVDDEIVAVFPPDAFVPGTLTAAALAALPVLLYEPGGNSRRVIDDWFGRAIADLKPVMELGNIEAIKQLVAAGLGCGLLPRLAVSGDNGAGGLVVRSLSPVLHRQLGMALRRDKVPDRGLRDVVAALRGLRGLSHSGSTSQTTPSRASRSSSSRLVGTS